MSYKIYYNGSFAVSPPVPKETRKRINRYGDSDNHWIMVDDTFLQWDGNTDFEDPTTPLQELIDNIFAPNGFTVEGEVRWQGDDDLDRGRISIKNNKIKSRCVRTVLIDEDLVKKWEALTKKQYEDFNNFINATLARFK